MLYPLISPFLSYPDLGALSRLPPPLPGIQAGGQGWRVGGSWYAPSLSVGVGGSWYLVRTIFISWVEYCEDQNASLMNFMRFAERFELEHGRPFGS